MTGAVEVVNKVTGVSKSRLTVRVVRVGVRAGDVPTADRAVQPTAVALLPGRADDQAQDGPDMCSERVDGFHVQRCGPVRRQKHWYNNPRHQRRAVSNYTTI